MKHSHNLLTDAVHIISEEHMKTQPNSSFLNRYTTLPVVLNMILTKSIILLEPTHWEDRNDAYYLEKYKCEKQLNTLLAACFTTKRETFHHWKVFASGSSGVCIEFIQDKLLFHFQNIDEVSYREVSYRKIKYNQNPPLSQWPFLKRQAYEDEGEFRIIYENLHEESKFKAFDINLDCIKRITLSPWLPKPVAESVLKIIRGINGCANIVVNRSTLLESKKWQDCIWPSR